VEATTFLARIITFGNGDMKQSFVVTYSKKQSNKDQLFGPKCTNTMFLTMIVEYIIPEFCNGTLSDFR